MCGKFTQQLVDGTMETGQPMRFADVIRLDDHGRRESRRMRWGLVRNSSNSPLIKPDHIHARAETIDEKPTFREAFRFSRGLLKVKTFNEGREIGRNKTEQFTLTPSNGEDVAIAVIWERWTHRDGDELYTYVMVTVAANELIGTITDRMPAVILRGDWAKWLGEEPATYEELKAMLKPYPSHLLLMAPEKRTPPPRRPRTPSEDQPTLF